MNEAWQIVPSPRPEDGSPEDLAMTARSREIRAALERLRAGSFLPGCPLLEDELRAAGDFIMLVYRGTPATEAARLVYEMKSSSDAAGGLFRTELALAWLGYV